MTDPAVEAYSRMGEAYDRLEEENRILAHTRRKNLDALHDALPEGGRLLELGAGTATEALEIARALDAHVTAVEPAPGLADVARRKVEDADAPVEVRTASAGEALATLADADLFDGLWASFSLAYEAPLADLRDPLAGVLAPGAPLVCSIPNPWSLPAPWRIIPRLRGTYAHKVGDARVRLHCASLREARRALAPAFELEHAEAVNALVPPARLGRVWNLLGPVAGLVERLDRVVAPRWPFRHLGDHTLLVLRRTDAPSSEPP